MALTYSEQTHVNVSALCQSDGIGCDGYNDDPRAEHGTCSCGCHSDWAPTYVTNADVLAWHLPSHTYRPATPEELISTDYAARRGSRTASDGTLYVLHEQYR